MLILAGGLISPVSAQLNPASNSQSTIDLSDVTEAFIRNMKLLQTRVPEADVRDQMETVIAQADDLGAFFRAKGTASKRRDLFEQQEELKFKKDLSKSDMRKLDDLRAKIKELDPDDSFGKGKKLYSETQNELIKMLDLIQTSDPVRKDIIRLIQQHLSVYNKALREY